MNNDIQLKLEKLLWNIAREECCLTKQKANCIVIMTEHDIKNTVKGLLNNSEFINLIQSINKSDVENNI